MVLGYFRVYLAIGKHLHILRLVCFCCCCCCCSFSGVRTSKRNLFMCIRDFTGQRRYYERNFCGRQSYLIVVNTWAQTTTTMTPMQWRVLMAHSFHPQMLFVQLFQRARVLVAAANEDSHKYLINRIYRIGLCAVLCSF